MTGEIPFPGNRIFPGIPGAMRITVADSEALERDYGFTPKTGIREGLRAFAEWYRKYAKDGNRT